MFVVYFRYFEGGQVHTEQAKTMEDAKVIALDLLEAGYTVSIDEE